MRKIYLMLAMLLSFAAGSYAQCTLTQANSCTCLGGGTNCDLLPDIIPGRPALLLNSTSGYVEYSQSGNGANNGRLRITVSTPNIGHGTMHTVAGNTYVCGTDTFTGTIPSICPDGITLPKVLVKQRIYHKNGNTMTYNDRNAGSMTYHPSHGHMHIDDWGVYTLRTATTDPNPLNWPVVGNGAKLAFCLLDFGSCTTYNKHCADAAGVTLNTVANQGMGGGNFGCSSTSQGISVGFADVYSQSLDGMWIVVPPGTCNGNYYIVCQQDPYDQFLEENDANNVVAVPVTLTKQVNTSPVISPAGPVHICAGQSVTLTCSSAANYLWSNGATTQSITVNQSGSYSCTINSGGACSTTSAPVDVIVGISASANASSTNICSGQSATLSSSATSATTASIQTFSNSTAQSIPDNNSTGISSNITVSGISPSTISPTTMVSVQVNITHTFDYDLELRLYAPSGEYRVLSYQRGSSGDNYTNTVFSQTGATFISDGSAPFTNTYKPSENISTFTGNANGVWTLKVYDRASNDVGTLNNWNIKLNNYTQNGLSYAWTSNPAGFTSSLQNPTAPVSPTQTTTYTVTATETGTGCTSTSAVTINVGTLTVNATGNTAICNGQSTTLTATGATTYNWTAPGGFNQSGGSITVSPAITTTYTVTGTTGSCTGQQNITVVVTPVPVVTTSGNVAICNGQSTTLTASGANSFYWTPPSGLSSQTGSSVTANPTSTQTYTVVGTTNGCSSSGQQLTVTVNPIPNVGTSGNATICNGQSTQITASGATTYVWSPSTGLNSTTGSSVTANPSQTITYTVNGTTNGCSNTAQVTVTVDPVPVVTTSANPTICSGQSTVLTASGASSYYWTPATGLSSQTGGSVTATPSATQVYTVVGTTNGCPSSGVQITVTVNNPPTVITSGNTAICAGQYVTLNAGGATSYLWTAPGGFSQTGNSITVNPSATTIYTVTGSSNGCSATAQLTVTVNPLPVVGVSANTSSICSGQSATITATGATTYTWTPATGLNTTTGSVVVATPTVTTTYVVTGSTNGCSSNNSITINSNTGAAPSMPGAITGTRTPCPGQSYSYTVANVAGAVSYQWTLPANSSLVSGGTTNNITILFASNFVSGKLYVAAVGNCGISSQRSTDIVRNIPAIPSSVSGQLAGVCNATLPYSASSVNGASSYTWAPPAGATVSSGQGTINSNIAYSVAFNNGNLCVTANNSCGSSAPRCVAVKKTPATPSAISGLSSVCQNQQGVQYSAASAGATTYNWYVSAGSGAVITSGQGTPTITVNFGTAAATVGVTASNSCGSSGTKTLPVAISCRQSNQSINIVAGRVTVSPNPTSGMLKLFFESDAFSNTVVRLSDIIGKTIIADNVSVEKGMQYHTMDLSGLNRGIYMLSIEQGQNKKAVKIVLE